MSSRENFHKCIWCKFTYILFMLHFSDKPFYAHTWKYTQIFAHPFSSQPINAMSLLTTRNKKGAYMHTHTQYVEELKLHMSIAHHTAMNITLKVIKLYFIELFVSLSLSVARFLWLQLCLLHCCCLFRDILNIEFIELNYLLEWMRGRERKREL